MELTQHLPKGYFIQPTALEVTPSMRIWREEVFGPVLSVLTFKTEEEAIELANASHYGLGAAVISKDDARCQRVAEVGVRSLFFCFFLFKNLFRGIE